MLKVLLFVLMSFSASAADDNAALVKYNLPPSGVPPITELDAHNDDLYAGAEIVPLQKELSAEEKQQENSSDLMYVEKETVLPDLQCNDAALLTQVKDFIYDNIRSDGDNSVKDKRSRILLVRNMHEFTDIAESEIKDNFAIQTALMHLKINEQRTIHRLCVSKDNNFSRFNEVYLIIYPYAGNYKVVVANLLKTQSGIAKATFTFKP